MNELKVKFVKQGKEPYEKIVTNLDELNSLELSEFLEIFIRLKKKVQYSKRVIDEILNTPDVSLSKELRNKAEDLFQVKISNNYNR